MSSPDLRSGGAPSTWRAATIRPTFSSLASGLSTPSRRGPTGGSQALALAWSRSSARCPAPLFFTMVSHEWHRSSQTSGIRAWMPTRGSLRVRLAAPTAYFPTRAGPPGCHRQHGWDDTLLRRRASCRRIDAGSYRKARRGRRQRSTGAPAAPAGTPTSPPLHRRFAPSGGVSNVYSKGLWSARSTTV